MRFRPRKDVLVLIATAFVVRALFIYAKGSNAPLLSGVDDSHYDAIAMKILSAHEYSDGWFPPGYSLFLSTIYALFGHSILAVRLVQALLGALTCVVTLLLGEQIFGRGAGRFAGWYLCFYPPHVFISWRLLAEPLFVLLLVMALFTAARLASTSRLLLAVMCGTLFGLANIVKSNLVALPVIVAGILARSAGPPWRRSFAMAAVILGSTLVVSTVTPLMNYSWSQGIFVPFAANGGHTLLMSNNPIADGYFVSPFSQEEGREFVRHYGYTERFRTASAAQTNRLAARLALVYILDQPAQFGRLVTRKLMNAFSPWPTSLVLRQSVPGTLVYAVTYTPVLILGLVGIFLAQHSKPGVQILDAILAVFVIMTMVFYGTPRFTLHITPYLLIFAGFALNRWREGMLPVSSPETSPA